jgi:hypothetical protein
LTIFLFSKVPPHPTVQKALTFASLGIYLFTIFLVALGTSQADNYQLPDTRYVKLFELTIPFLLGSFQEWVLKI